MTRARRARRRWRAHACWRDPECRSHGAPSRLYLFTPLGDLTLALRRDDWSQLWLPVRTRTPWSAEATRWSRWWSPVVWSPPRRRRP